MGNIPYEERRVQDSHAAGPSWIFAIVHGSHRRKTHDINVVKDDSYGFPSLSPDSILLIDRAYIDYNWLYSLTRSKLFFVMKAKSNMNYTVLGQQEFTKNKGIVSDCLIMLSGVASHENYPENQIVPRN